MRKELYLDETHKRLEATDGSLADQVYRHVTHRILSGRWISGDIIDRKTVAKELNVSQAPVGEALIRLSHEGFLETAPRRHTRVRIVRKEDVRGQLVLRLALERQAVAMAHGEPIRRVKERLLALAEEVDRYQPKTPAAWPSEIAFHRALVEVAECPALSSEFDRVMQRNYFVSINSAHVVLAWRESADAQHSRLVDALCTDDTEEADSAIMGHYAEDCRAMLQPHQGMNPEDKVARSPPSSVRS